MSKIGDEMYGAPVSVDTANKANYRAWTNDGYGVIYYIPYTFRRMFPFEATWKANYAHAMFNLYWHYSLVIVAAYVALVYWGQKRMANRKPYSLKGPLFVWNAVLAVFSFVAFVRMAEEMFFVLANHTFQDSVCLSMDPDGASAFWALMFALSKVVELFDTMFIVLRKRSLIFLHWYHHAAVLVYVWHGACILTPASRWFMTMNCFVHSVMYTYYAITSRGYRLPRWFAMLVTTLQTAQMLVGVGITCYVTALKWRQPSVVCQQSVGNLTLCFGIYISFAILFIHFFCNAYMGSRKTRKDGAVTACGKAVTDAHDIVKSGETKTLLNGDAKRSNGRTISVTGDVVSDGVVSISNNSVKNKDD